MKTKNTDKVTGNNVPTTPVTLGLGVLVAALGPIYKKVRFPNEASAIKGFSLLLHSGGMEAFGHDIYGLSSASQIAVLEKNDVRFEVLND